MKFAFHKLRLEMKHEMDKLNSKFKELEKGLKEVWATIEDLKEESASLKAFKIFQENETQLLKQELEKVNLEQANTKVELKEEREKNH